MKKPYQNNMNLDNLSNKERTRLMKEGGCFRCKKHGHRARDHPPENEEKKHDRKLTPIQVQTAMSRMNEKERRELLETIKKEGLLVLKKTAEPEAAQTEMKKTTLKDLVGQVKTMTKEESMELIKLVKGEEKSDLLEEETAPVQISPSLDVYSV